MNIRIFVLAVLAVPLLAAPSWAQATWVSGTGSDSNVGTADSPYATFAVALANTAAGGVISVQSPGDFGPVTISQAVTIDGGGGSAPDTRVKLKLLNHRLSRRTEMMRMEYEIPRS